MTIKDKLALKIGRAYIRYLFAPGFSVRNLDRFERIKLEVKTELNALRASSSSAKSEV